MVIPNITSWRFYWNALFIMYSIMWINVFFQIFGMIFLVILVIATGLLFFLPSLVGSDAIPSEFQTLRWEKLHNLNILVAQMIKMEMEISIRDHLPFFENKIKLLHCLKHKTIYKCFKGLIVIVVPFWNPLGALLMYLSTQETGQVLLNI